MPYQLLLSELLTTAGAHIALVAAVAALLLATWLVGAYR